MLHQLSLSSELMPSHHGMPVELCADGAYSTRKQVMTHAGSSLRRAAHANIVSCLAVTADRLAVASMSVSTPLGGHAGCSLLAGESSTAAVQTFINCVLNIAAAVVPSQPLCAYQLSAWLMHAVQQAW